MRASIRIVLMLMFCLSTGLYSQSLDSIIFRRATLKKENPKIKSLDSLRKKFGQSLIKLTNEGYSVSTDEIEKPILYYTKNDSLEIGLERHIKDKLRGNQNRFKAYFEIEIDWNGEINFIKLKRYKGDIFNVDFVSLWQGVKAYPATEFCIPVKEIVLIPIINN